MKDVTVQLFDGMRHDIFREKEAGKVCEYLYGWMRENLLQISYGIIVIILNPVVKSFWEPFMK